MKATCAGWLRWCWRWTHGISVHSFLIYILTGIALFNFGNPCMVSASTEDFGIILLSPREVTSGSREIMTLSVQITNQLPESRAFEVSAITPSGWEYCAYPANIEVEPAEPEVVFISITLPNYVPAGDYIIEPTVSLAGIPSSITSTSVSVVVPETHGFELVPNQLEKLRILSGQEIVYGFTASNSGNAALDVDVQVDSRPAWVYSVNPPDSRIHLEPNQSVNIDITFSIPEILDRSTSHWVNLSLRSTDPDLGVPDASASLSADVIVTGCPGGSNYASLDGEIETSLAFGEDIDPDLTVSMNNLFAILPDGSTFTADIRNLLIAGDGSGSFTQNERVNVEYTGRDGTYVRAGDGIVNLLAPLVDRNISGRGIEVQFSDDEADCLLFHVRSQGSRVREKTGFQVAYQPGDMMIRLTTLYDARRHESGSTIEDPDAFANVGLGLAYETDDRLLFTGETCLSKSTDLGWDDAWRFTGRYHTDRFTGTCEWLRAGPVYQGGWEDTELRRFNISWSPMDNFRLWGNYYRSQNNLDENPEIVGRIHRNLGFGAMWNVADLGRFRASHRVNRTGDVLTHNWTDLTRVNVLSFTRDWGNISTTASWQEQVGEGMTIDNHSISRMLRFNCTARFNPNNSLRIGIGTGWDSIYNGLNANRITDFNVGGRFYLSRRFSINLDIDRYMGGAQGSRTNIYGLAAWELPGNRELNFRLRHYTWAYGDDTEMIVQYVTPISIPLPMFPIMGSVRGRIYYADDPSKGLHGVILYTDGFESASDLDGQFYFTNLDPGEQFLLIDNTTLDVGLVPDVDLPMPLFIEIGKTTEIEIPVIYTGSIGGSVYLASNGMLSPQADYIIELDGPDGITGRSTLLGGGFLFGNLKPGSYTITLQTGNLPEYHEVMGPVSFEIGLSPGEVIDEVLFIVRKVEREFEVVLDVTEGE